MSWGMDVQAYYREGRDITEVKKSQIEAICQCGYITLKPTNEFEKQNGGLVVKRKNVTVIDDVTGNVIERLHARRLQACNACGNQWK